MKKTTVPKPTYQLLLTCEHAGNRVPRKYEALFRNAADVLASHRGWDPGALDIARSLANKFGVALPAVFWSRLLVESNRSPTNPRIWSKYTVALPAEERERILTEYWWPHRRTVETAVSEAADRGRRVVHVAVHTFTDVLNGEVRNADIGLLYDPARPSELALCKRWERILRELDPALRLRRNYPYRGNADGLPTWLRRKFPDRYYAGVELEVNQALLASPRRGPVKVALGSSIARLLAESPSQ
jgi:predicted N-formylglutamate amidohydrolase